MSVATSNGHNHTDSSSSSGSDADVGDDVLKSEEDVIEPELHLEFFDEVHQNNAFKSLNMMRKNRHFCDVILHVRNGNSEIHAHRAVLASASSYLFELFTVDLDQKRSENIITYKLNGGYDSNALQILVDYAYTGKLDVRYTDVKSVFTAAKNLKMERVMQICAQHLIKHLSVDNCIEIRSLTGIAKSKDLVQQVDAFIAQEFPKISKGNNDILNLYCARIEVLNQSREEMSLVNENSLCRLVLEWIKREVNAENVNMSKLSEKTFMLYLALDNSLQDCSSLPCGDISDTEIVQDYKKLSLKDRQSGQKKKKILGQPSKPRVLIYNREIGDEFEELESDWNLIASCSVGEHSFLALVTLAGKLSTLSIQLRLNTPSTPSPVQTPSTSRPASEEKPDLYCALANMSAQRCSFGSGNLSDTIIVCGGYDRSECLQTVEQYFPETNVWKPLPSMNESRGRFNIAVVDDKVYAICGSNGTTELGTVEMFDKNVGKWKKMPKMPSPKCHSGVCVLDGLVYCVGGWNGQVGTKQCEVFNPVTQNWTSIAPLNTGRYQASVAAYNKLVYAIGGCNGWNCLNSVEVYHPDEDVWRPSKPMITARRGCGVAVVQGRLYVIGGLDGSNSLSTTEVFDDDTQSWSLGPNMTTPRANVGVAVVGDRLYAIGGFSGKTFLNTIEYLDLKTNEWTTFIPKGSCELLLKRKPRSRKNSRKSVSEDKKPTFNGYTSEEKKNDRAKWKARMFDTVFRKILTNPLPVMEESLRVLAKIVDNILKDPDNVKLRSLKKTNPTIKNKVLMVHGGVECLRTLGFEESTEQHTLPATFSVDVLLKFKTEVEEWKGSNYSTEKFQQVTKGDDETIEKVVLPPLLLTFTNPFLRRIETVSHSVLQHEDEKLQRRAKKLVPLDTLETTAAERLREIHYHIKKNKLPDPNLTVQDFLILEVLRWFKRDFFEWVNNPKCEQCGDDTDYSHMCTDATLFTYTDRVEVHKCKSCHSLTFFGRYNDLNILLETRKGRCGEWANTFMLFCRALGWDSRFVIDEGDHVWTEVYSIGQKRWLHCDPCENLCDVPLIYENGWKKEISYVIAYSSEEVQDVSWRYSSDHKAVLKRRKNCTEKQLIEAMFDIRRRLQKDLSESRRNYLARRTLEELVELLLEKKPTDKDKHGRTSGSAMWRMARGEIHDMTYGSYVWSLRPDECEDSITLKYSTSLNKYELVCDDQKVAKEIHGWHKGTFGYSTIFRKEEEDWKMVYLARKETETTGSISWKVDLKDTGRTVNTIHLYFDYTTFENGVINVKVCSEDACYTLPKGEKSHIFTEFLGSKEITVSAVLLGGTGDNAWQHSQLFRQSTESTEFPFSLKIVLT